MGSHCPMFDDPIKWTHHCQERELEAGEEQRRQQAIQARPGHGSRRREYVGFNQEKYELYIYYIIYIYIVLYMLPPQKKNSPVLMLTMIIVSTIDVTRVHP